MEYILQWFEYPLTISTNSAADTKPETGGDGERVAMEDFFQYLRKQMYSGGLTAKRG